MKNERRHLGVLCTTHALGGMELNLLRLAGWMKERGWKATAVGVACTPFLAHAADYGLDAVPVGGYRKYFDFSGAKTLADSLRSSGIDVLILSANRDINTAVLAKEFYYPALKVIYLQQMQLGIAKKGIAHTWQYRRLDAWVAPLEWLAAQARENTRMPEERIHVIPLGIETARFAGTPNRKAQARRLLELPQDAFIVGTVGRYDEGKYQEVLLRAASRLADAGSRVDVLLVGEDTRDEKQQYGRRLQQIAEDAGISGQVHFRPFRSDVETAYAAMDAFAMTTPAETYGMVTVEAMASGVPVIAANGGGSPELLDGGNAGLLVPPRNDEVLAAAIETLQSDPGRRAALAQAGKARTEEHYTNHVQCACMEELIL